MFWIFTNEIGTFAVFFSYPFTLLIYITIVTANALQNAFCQLRVFLDLKVNAYPIRSHRESPQLVQVIRVADQKCRLKTCTTPLIIVVIEPVYRLDVIFYVSSFLLLHFFWIVYELLMQRRQFIIENILDCFYFCFVDFPQLTKLLVNSPKSLNSSSCDSLTILIVLFSSLEKFFLFFLVKPPYLVCNLGIMESGSKFSIGKDRIAATADLGRHVPFE